MGLWQPLKTILRSVPRIKCWNLRHWRRKDSDAFQARTFQRPTLHSEDYNSYLKDWLPKIPRNERTGDCSFIFCHGPLTISGLWVSRLLLNSSHDQVWKGRTSSNDPGLFFFCAFWGFSHIKNLVVLLYLYRISHFSFLVRS